MLLPSSVEIISRTQYNHLDYHPLVRLNCTYLAHVFLTIKLKETAFFPKTPFPGTAEIEM